MEVDVGCAKIIPSHNINPSTKRLCNDRWSTLTLRLSDLSIGLEKFSSTINNGEFIKIRLGLL